MTPRNHDLPPELEEIGARLSAERREASTLELDELRLRARKRGSSGRRARPGVRNRTVTAILAVALVGGGGGAALAIPGGQGKGGGAANGQYCSQKHSDKVTCPP